MINSIEKSQDRDYIYFQYITDDEINILYIYTKNILKIHYI